MTREGYAYEPVELTSGKTEPHPCECEACLIHLERELMISLKKYKNKILEEIVFASGKGGQVDYIGMIDGDKLYDKIDKL